MKRKNSFKVPAEVLKKNVMREDIRNLNAEFQKMGGVVQYRSTRKGGVFLLSHPDPEYLQNFRVRLLYALDILPKKELTEELKRKLVGEGEIKRKPEAVEKKAEKPPQERAPERVVERRRPEEPERVVKRVERKHYVPPEVMPYYEHVKDSIMKGAVDDGDIIRMAYEKNYDEEWIRVLKRLLWNNKCIAPPEECPHRKKKMRLEDMMKMCFDKGEKCDYMQSYFSDLYPQWRENLDRMFGEFKDKRVEVIGKISEVYPIERGKESHFKMLIYDTLVRPAKKKGSYKKTRKLWIRVPFRDFAVFSRPRPFHIGDIIRFTGKMILHGYFHDYWVINLDSMDVIEERGEEEIAVPARRGG